MRILRSCPRGLLLGLLAAVLPGLVLVTPVTADPLLAEVENTGSQLVFLPIVPFAKLVLTVTGPCGFEYRQAVTSGEPTFALDPPPGGPTIDGVYRYNLMREEAVDPGVVEKLLQAREAGDLELPKLFCREGKLPAPPISQAEGFEVLNGEIVYDPDAVEDSGFQDSGFQDSGGLALPGLRFQTSAEPPSPVTRDNVILDDLIVDGSACIGFDCVNGESFNFDTIRLKENNLRIKFDDTSLVPGFPATDWQLTANASAKGGASKFSIDDISGNRTPFTVEANARSHALYVDDGGRIGSRTSTPSVEMHTIDGDTPTLRLQQDGSSGFAPQTWDIAGNETNFFIRDVTNDSTLPIRVQPGAPTSSLHIHSSGDIGIGITSTPAAKLEVDGGVVVTGGFSAASSRAIKQDFAPLDRAALLDGLRKLPLQSWSYRDGDDRSRHIGPFAEDFSAAFGLGGSDKHIDLVDSTGITLAALQAVLDLLAERDQEVARLADRLAALEVALSEAAARP